MTNASRQPRTGTARDGLPTGAGTAPAHDVADPHPANEEH